MSGKRILTEAVVVALVGIVLALIANFLSPRGLKLSRDYFFKSTRAATNASPGGTQPPVSSTQLVSNVTNFLPAVGGTNKPSPREALAARLQQKGLTLADSNTVFALYHDPRHQQGLVIFLDARDDEHYQAGHVPSAVQVDYYRYEKYLPSAMPAVLNAQQVVVYCNGGDCEDSEFTALLLSNSGIPASKFLVYGGGFTEWRTNGWPVELGARNSGVITNLPARAAAPPAGATTSNRP